jgi:CheY-like chemotaxis protein
MARRILVVDDDADSREALSALFQTWGCEVATAETGEQALAAVMVGTPDVVVADLTLPAMDGCELARRLRALPAGDGIRLLAFSGHAEAEEIARARASGFDDYVVKGADPDRLRDLVVNGTGDSPAR